MDVELNLETKTHIYFTKTNKITKPCRFGGEASDPVHVQTNIIQFRIFISFLGTGLVTSSLRTTLITIFTQRVWREVNGPACTNENYLI